MSTHKTTISQEVATSFLKNIFPQGVSKFEIITGGEGSQAFSFSVFEDRYIIRINKNSGEGFRKDQYAYVHFTSSAVPIPEVCKIGKIDDTLHFCISKRAEGKLLDSYTKEEKRALASELFATLDAIHAVDISTTQGYGEWDSNGQAKGKSWNEHLLALDYRVVGTPENPGLFETSFLEKDFWEKVSNKITKLARFCPEERRLIHADCGFDNVLSDGKKITGVIDWENSAYGDYLYDLAWLSLWWNEIGYEPMYLEYSINSGLQVEHFNERVLCYKLQIGLNALIFFAYSNQEDKYKYAKGILEKLF